MKRNKLAMKHWMCVCFIAALCGNLAACSDKDKDNTSSYNPNEPVTITRFTPAEGTNGQEIVIYGTNFGLDSTQVNVTIGGKKAKLSYVKADSIGCIVPYWTESGRFEVEVKIAQQSAKATTKYAYISPVVVRTLIGYRINDGNPGWKDGTFGTGKDDGSATFGKQAAFMKFDPQNHDHLYVAYEDFDYSGYGVQLFDLKAKTVTTVMHGTKCFEGKRLRAIDFTKKGDMVIATDRDDNGDHSTSVWIVKRNADGGFTDESKCEVLAAYKQCNTVAVHPVNGELYFNSYGNNAIYRLDVTKFYANASETTHWVPYLTGNNYEQILTLGASRWNFNITIHPTGKYAYVIALNQHCIYRMDYDDSTKRFKQPYLVSGQQGVKGWADGKGDGTLMNFPYQGIFVKNPDYVAQGKEDIYDFYFCDYDNYCVRYLTPNGRVRTFAGRGATSAMGDGNTWGSEDGDLRETARFGSPTGIAYDERTETFYVFDTYYKSVRTISR